MTEQLNVRTNAIEEFYDVGEQIGSGQFAVVKKLHSKSCGNTFAAKFMKKRRSKALKRGTSQEQFLREADVLRSIEHKGVIYLHDIFETKGEFVLVLELLSGGELFEFLSEQEFLTEDEAVGFLKQVIEAIEYLHKKRIVHLDIKPENIVLKEEKSSQIKLIDFGLARKLSQGEMVREIMGTPEFVAPEIIAFEAVGTETDMWAIGVLTYIMLSGASPFLGDDVNETFSNISMVDYEFDDEYFKDISEPAKDFISTLLVKDKSERMSAEECLQHEWMQDLDDQESPNTSEDDDICDSFIPQTPIKQKNSLKKRRSTMIKTDAFKAFTARARWQKSLNKVIAISRLALLGKKNSPIQRQTSSDESTKPVPNIETNQDDNNDGKDNKTDDFAKLEEKLKNIEVKSDREEEKATSDSIVKEQLVTEKETLVEDLNSSDSSFGVLKKTTDEKNRLNSSENGREILKTNTTCVSKDEAKTLPEIKKADEQVKPDILVKSNTEGSLPTVTRTEKNSNRFESLTGSKIASENGKASQTVPEIGERRASGESSRHRQQLESANEQHVRRRESKEEGKHQQEIAVNTTNEGTGKKHLEDTAWLRKQKPFYLNKDRKEASKVKKGFTSTKAEILKWEKKSSSESTTARLLTSRGNVKKEEQRLSLPGIPKTELKKPQDSRHERHSIGVVREPERERRVYTTTMRIAPEKEDIDSKRNLITNLNTSRQLKDETIGEVTRHHDQDIKTTIDTGTDCANNTKRSSLTRIQGSTVHKQDDAAIIDKEHTFVIRTSLHSQDDSESDVESEVDKEEDNTAKEQNGTTHSGKKVSLAFVNYEPGKKEMEAFPQLSLTLQKSPTSPDAKEDDFVWVVTTEKNKRRDFLTRVLAPKVKAAKNSQFEGDVFEKRRIRHKPIGEKGPPKVRTRSSSSPSVSSSVPEVRIKHHSVATAPMMTHDGKNVPTVQLSSDMPALSFKIQMGEIKLADP